MIGRCPSGCDKASNWLMYQQGGCRALSKGGHGRYFCRLAQPFDEPESKFQQQCIQHTLRLVCPPIEWKRGTTGRSTPALRDFRHQCVCLNKPLYNNFVNVASFCDNRSTPHIRIEPGSLRHRQRGLTIFGYYVRVYFQGARKIPLWANRASVLLVHLPSKPITKSGFSRLLPTIFVQVVKFLSRG